MNMVGFDARPRDEKEAIWAGGAEAEEDIDDEFHSVPMFPKL